MGPGVRLGATAFLAAKSDSSSAAFTWTPFGRLGLVLVRVRVSELTLT